jgi:hypothetical protein
MTIAISTTTDCLDCAHSYADAQNVLRCRADAIKCTPSLSEQCKRPERRREPGADGIESPAHRVWYCDSIGRGD